MTRVAEPATGSDDPEFTVAVRALCAFTARAGDLDLRFTPAPSAEEGIAGHARLAARRGPDYQSELPLSGRCGPLRVRGRADGWDAQARCVEEIKTHRGDLSRQPANHRALHWAQLRVYGWLACEHFGLSTVDLALVYLDIDTDTVTRLTEVADADSLHRFFVAQCDAYIAWCQQEQAHRRARDAALRVLPFPLPAMRPGQRDLAEAVYRVARAGRSLLAQAPTGIGKTLGTLFPMLRAAGSEGLDRVFWLSAKTPGRRLALDALDLLRRGPAAVTEAIGTAVPVRAGDAGDGAPTAPAPAARVPLRVLELVARDKACEHPELACHGESCPLARGFWDRLPAARQTAIDAAVEGPGALLDKSRLRALALAHGLCPYYLGQELARWSDVVVGDYNHWFDLHALLHAWTLDQGWRVGLLIDEAHNLVERARAMYSGELDQAALRAVRPATRGPLRRALDRLNRCWNDLQREGDAAYTVFDTVPAAFAEALRSAAAELAEALADPTRPPDPALQALAFDVIHLAGLVESFGPHSLFDLTRTAPPGGGASGDDPDPARTAARRRPASRSVLCVRNLVPAPHLQPRWSAARTAVLFSATLTPRDFHADLLGLPEDTAWIDVATPFQARQLRVQVVRRISTRWRDREASVGPIVRELAEQYARRPGHYLVFLSSYDYLDRVFAALRETHPDLPAWAQQRRMDEPAREAFLARFVPGGQGVGFAVLGGAFAEGIDLPGDRLVGAFVATLGLPQVNPANEQLRTRLETLFPGRGHDYAYLYPGLQKVVQAAGRVIRTPEDEGVLFLLDDRYARAPVRALLPAWWGLGR